MVNSDAMRLSLELAGKVCLSTDKIVWTGEDIEKFVSEMYDLIMKKTKEKS